MKRFIATLLTFCMLLSMLPILPAQAGNPLLEPPSDVVFDLGSGELEIGFGGRSLTTSQKDWLDDIADVEINGEHYKKNNGSYSFVREDEKIYIANHNIALPKNTIKILAPKYEAYTTTYTHPIIKKMTDGLSINSVYLGSAGDEVKRSASVSVRLDYEYNSTENAALNTLIMRGLKSMTIDGKTFNIRDAHDGRLSFFLRDTVVSMYDATPDGKLAVDHFKKQTNHQVVMTFADGNELKYEDPGYQAPGEKPSKEDPNSSQDQAVDKNTGGMADGWGFVKFEQAANGWNGARMESDLPQDQWYDHYIKNIRCVFIDDLYFADRQDTPGDVTLQNDVLAFATYGRVFNSDPHKMVIVFKDGNTITHIDAGYEPPKKPKDLNQYLKDKPTIKDEPSNPSTGEVSQKYIFSSVSFEESYGLPEITVRFKGAEAKDALRDMQSFTINGKNYQNPDLWTVSYKGFICNAPEVINPLYGKDKMDLTFFWKDGTHSIISKTVTPVQDPDEPKKPEKPKKPELSTEEQHLEDKKVGVQVTAPAGALPKNVGLSVLVKGAKEVQEASPSYAKAVANKAQITAFDIFFSWDNQPVQPKKPVSVSLPIGTHDPKTLVVYHIAQDGKAEKVEAIQVVDNRVTFSVDRFSIYALASGNKETVKPDKPKGKLAECYPIEKMALEKASWGDSKYMRIYLKNYKKPEGDAREALEKAFKEATITLNGQDFTGITVSVSYNKIEINEFDEVGPKLKKAWEAAGDEAKIKMTFSDGSHWQNYQEETKTIADQLALTGLKEKMNWMQELGSIVLQSKGANKLSDGERKALADEFRKATWLVNGESIQDVAVGYTIGLVEGYEVYQLNTDFYEAYTKQSPAALKVTFADGSSWDNGVTPGGSADKHEYDLIDDLPAGDYTLSFDVRQPDGSPSRFANVLDKKAKLTVEKGKKTVTFLITSDAKLIIDLAVGKDGQFKSTKDAIYGKPEENRKTYTGVFEDLDKAYELAVLNTMMQGQISDKGDFDKYVKANLVFESPVIKGWQGFDLADKPGFDQAKNDDNLRLKLIDQRVDTNGDGNISKEELQKAKGKLDLSNEKIGPTPDVSILKDLGPGVTELYLDANGIKSLPDGFFDNMTGIGHISLSGNQLTTLPAKAFAKNTKLHTLWMEGNQLTELAPDLLANNPGLLELAISRNQITSLPKGLLANNTKLQKLYASGNGLTSIDDDTFGRMKRLEGIQLGDNRLTHLPDAIGNLERLAELNLENNLLTDIPKNMSKLRNLYKVNLSNNRIKALDDGFWLRMARNSASMSNKYPDLDVSGNLLTDIPFDKMLAQKGKFNKFDVSRNYLPAKISQEEADKLQSLGITIGAGMSNRYQPQMTAMNVSLKAEAGQLTLSQDMDMLQMALWQIKDFYLWGNFLDPESYLAFLKDQLYKKHNITTINDQLAIAQILNKMGWDWQIRTIIEKKDGETYREISNKLLENEGHNGRVSDVDPVDAKTFTFTDAGMKAGDRYRLTRILTTKSGVAPYAESLRYSVEATAGSEGSKPQPQPEEAIAWTVPIQVLHETKNTPSMAANVFSDKVQVKKTGDGYATTLTFKPLSMGGLTGYMQDVDVYKTKDDQTLGKIRALNLTDIQKDAKGLTAVTFMTKEKPQDLYYATVYFTMGEPNGKNTTDANVRMLLNWDQAQANKPLPVDQEKAAKAGLEKAIAQAEGKLADGKAYTETSKKAVETALKDAKIALEKNTAAMKAATKILNAAVEGLSTKPSSEPEERALTVKAFIRHASKDQASMANKAFFPQVDVVEKDDQATYTLYFKTMAIQGLEGHITGISVDGQPAEIVAGRDGSYQYGFRFTRPSLKEKELKLTFSVDRMAGFDQDAILVLDWSGKAQPPIVGPGSAGSAAAPDKQFLEDKNFKALLEEAEDFIKDQKNANKDLTALQAAVKEAKAAKSQKEKEQAKKTLVKALGDVKKAADQKKDQPAAKGDKKFTLTQPKTGYISGYPNGTFRPDQLVKRAEAAAMLAQFVIANQKADHLPKDVPSESWYMDSMQTLIGAGLLFGYGDGTVKPNKAVTRAEMTAFIVRMKGLEPQTGQYTDVLTNHWANQVIGAARQAGIVAGYPDGSFKPDQAITRAEAVAMVNRAFGYTGRGSSRNFADVTPAHWAYGEIQKAVRV